MAGAGNSKKNVPIDRTGQIFRCYQVVRTIPRDPDGRYHVLKCDQCGAVGRSKWFEKSRIFCPMPCDCGDFRYSKLVVGDVRNGKEILKIDVSFRNGVKHYRILVRCLNCGAESTVTELNRLADKPGKLQTYCRHCKGDALRVDHIGQTIGTWKIIEEGRDKMTCRCLKCRNEITLLRKHIGTLLKRKCRRCRELGI
jgi:hypothetical protein